MDTGLKSWAMTLGASAVAVTIALGYESVLVRWGSRVVDMLLVIVHPLGPS